MGPGKEGLKSRKRHFFKAIFEAAGIIFTFFKDLSYFKYTPPVASAAGRRPPKGGLCFFWVSVRKTIVYVDGFNLYYALKSLRVRSSRSEMDDFLCVNRSLFLHTAVLELPFAPAVAESV